MGATLIYVTAGSRDEALAIGRALVESRLAACANIVPAVTSVYWWEGQPRQDDEAVLICKTRPELVDAVIERVKALHSYACPCVVALPITQGNPAFLDWIAQETAQAEA